MRGVVLSVRVRVAALAAGVVASALVVSGCGPGGAPNNPNVTVSGNVLTIVAGQPPGAQTAVDADVLDAEKLALQQAGAKVGPYALRLQVVHGAKVSVNARAAISQKKAIAYLGEIAPGTSGVSTQITNELGLLEFSPTDTAVYLTKTSAAVKDSPHHFFPSRKNFGPTFARVVPTTAAEAKATVTKMHALGLQRVYVADDGSYYGASTALAVRQDAAGAGLSVVSSPSGADAVFYAGLPGAATTHALDAAAAASPSATLFAPSALYDNGFVAGLSAAAQQHLYVSAPGFLPGHYPAAGQQFVTTFTSTFGHRPQPQAVFGYAAMQGLVAALRTAGDKADERAQVIADVRDLHESQSPLGTYSLNGGDTNIAPFIFARPVAGSLVPRAAG